MPLAAPAKAHGWMSTTYSKWRDGGIRVLIYIHTYL
jgi:hypothetical protein